MICSLDTLNREQVAELACHQIARVQSWPTCLLCHTRHRSNPGTPAAYAGPIAWTARIFGWDCLCHRHEPKSWIESILSTIFISILNNQIQNNNILSNNFSWIRESLILNYFTIKIYKSLKICKNSLYFTEVKLFWLNKVKKVYDQIFLPLCLFH